MRTPTRRELDLMAGRVEAGADPADLAGWISRVTGTDLPVEVLTAAATDLRDGRGDAWYAAADAQEVPIGKRVRDRGGEYLARLDPAMRADVEAIVAEMREADAAERKRAAWDAATRWDRDRDLTRWAEADDRDIHPARGSSGSDSQLAARGMLGNAGGDRHWVVKLGYADEGVEMATMDRWEELLADLDAAAARVPAGLVELYLHVVCPTREQAWAVAAQRARAVTGLSPSAATAGEARSPESLEAGELLERLREEERY